MTTKRTWIDTKALSVLRAAYLAEVERFAEGLRPRFEAGELRKNVPSDYPAAQTPGAIPDTPMERLERLCEERFGLNGRRYYEARIPEVEAAAHLVLAVSPHVVVAVDDDDGAMIWDQACHAVALDVLASARSRGWTRRRARRAA